MELLKFSRLSIISLMIISFLSSCWHWLYIALDEGNAKHSSTIKYDGDTTDIYNYINVDGFYHITNKLKTDTFFGDDYSTLYFFRNGTYSEDYGIYSNILLKSDSLSNIVKGNFPWKKRKEWGINCGVYKINNNIIVVEVFSTIFYGWNVFRRYYKIIDRSHLLYYKCVYLFKENEFPMSNKNYIYEFVSATNLPSSDDLMVRHKKWLWKDKKAYKRWKEEYKKARKKNKK